MLRIKSAYPVAGMDGTFAAHILLNNGALMIVTIEGGRWPEFAFHTEGGRKVMGLDAAFFPGAQDKTPHKERQLTDKLAGSLELMCRAADGDLTATDLGNAHTEAALDLSIHRKARGV
jgi:hypothetical protein